MKPKTRARDQARGKRVTGKDRGCASGRGRRQRESEVFREREVRKGEVRVKACGRVDVLFVSPAATARKREFGPGGGKEGQVASATGGAQQQF